jgi:transposase
VAAVTQIAPTRWVGLDLHKEYLLATGVNAEKQQVFGPARVQIGQIEAWAKKYLTKQDAVILEMTTNTWKIYDLLVPLVHSVTVVHPPHVALIVKARVMNDKKAALALAQLHAADLIPGIWVPDQQVRDLRAIVEQRRKHVNLVVTVKNRLHAVLHRHDVQPPEGLDLFAEDVRNWWLLLPVSAAEKIRIQSDLDTLFFAQNQKRLMEAYLAQAAVQDERIPLLIQLPGIALIGAVTILAAVGDISRFPTDRQLVGYAGLGAAVHDSGKTHRTGRITKSGRRDLRYTMTEAAHHAIDKHPHWKAQFERLEPRLGRNKAIVAIARKLLIVVWHVLTEGSADKYADPEKVAYSMFQFAYRVGVDKLPDAISATQYTRDQLDRLGIGQELTEINNGTKRPKLPKSRLAQDTAPATSKPVESTD